MTVQRAVLKGSIASLVEIRNMFTCDVVESGGDTFAILWGAYMSSIMDTLTPLSVNTVIWYEYEVQQWVTPSWEPQFTVTINEPGGTTEELLPYQAAIVLIGKAAGIKRVGRKFLGPIREGYGLGGVLGPGMIVLAAAALLAYITPFTGIGGGTITPGILDKTGTFRPFTSGLVSSLIGSMRRRKPGLGI